MVQREKSVLIRDVGKFLSWDLLRLCIILNKTERVVPVLQRYFVFTGFLGATVCHFSTKKRIAKIGSSYKVGTKHEDACETTDSTGSFILVTTPADI